MCSIFITELQTLFHFRWVVAALWLGFRLSIVRDSMLLYQTKEA
jgi:hypothetical protein